MDWFESVSFKDRNLKHAFIAWLNSRHMLHTRDRMIRWGLTIHPNCLLCNSQDESRQHLIFYCSYSAEVWLFHLEGPCFSSNII